MLSHRHGRNKNKKFNLQKKHSKKLYIFLKTFFLYKFSKLLMEFYALHKVDTF